MGYKCGNCKKTVEFDAQNIGIKCPHCGSKLFYKERPTKAKQLLAR
ncbi:MAG: DNA-directed RNA polymerase subunit P [Thermoplasmata archaeon HGW-Thermoplasmata-1]|nr:MAG: DNA-directed RNA polymerase subunit P [Thermoplasmata archaeon HGW-Thermoplasmata-1]